MTPKTELFNHAERVAGRLLSDRVMDHIWWSHLVETGYITEEDYEWVKENVEFSVIARSRETTDATDKASDR